MSKKRELLGFLFGAYYVCVVFTLNRFFFPSTSSTTSVRADFSILEEIQILRCHVPGIWYAVSRVGNAMPCRHTDNRYDILVHDVHIL